MCLKDSDWFLTRLYIASQWSNGSNCSADLTQPSFVKLTWRKQETGKWSHCRRGGPSPLCPGPRWCEPGGQWPREGRHYGLELGGSPRNRAGRRQHETAPGRCWRVQKIALCVNKLSTLWMMKERHYHINVEGFTNFWSTCQAAGLLHLISCNIILINPHTTRTLKQY